MSRRLIGFVITIIVLNAVDIAIAVTVSRLVGEASTVSETYDMPFSSIFDYSLAVFPAGVRPTRGGASLLSNTFNSLIM